MMLSSPWSSRRNASERAAAQAWDYLTSAVASAGDNARSAAGAAGDTARFVGRATGKRGSRLAAETGSRVGSTADEAWRRANAAVDALAGRRPSTPWTLLIVVGMAGVAIGFAAAATLRTAVNRSADRSEFEPAPPPTAERVHFDAG